MSSNKSLVLLLERQFPLRRDFHLDISDVNFSHGASPGVIKTTVTSSLVPLKLFCEDIDCARTPRIKENGKDNILFRWHHAPANHVDWVEAVTCKLQQPLIHSSFTKFWSSNEQSNRRGSKNVLFMRPTSEVFYAEVSKENTSASPGGLEALIMPYLDWATLDVLLNRQAAIDFLLSDELPPEKRTHYYGASEDSEIRFTSASFVSQRPLHLPRSLDQYQYPTLALSFSRIEDQVVPQQTKDASGSKALLVNQLWLITTEEAGIISFFSDTLGDDQNDSSHSKLKHNISSRLNSITSPSDVCSDLHDLSALMIDECVKILLDDLNPRDLQFLDCYRDAIGLLRQECITSLADFRDQDIHENIETIATVKADDELSMVLRASAIMNELQILYDIVQEQDRIIHMFCTKRWGQTWTNSGTTGALILKDTVKKLQNFLSEFKKLESNCTGIKSDLLSLLDLRQKRASLQEAHAAVQQAAETSHQTQLSLDLSKTSARQNRAMVIFTVVTVIFLPLSFFASFFALNIDGLQPVTMSRFWSFTGPISVAVVVLAVLAAFARRYLEFRKERSRVEDKASKSV